MTAILLALGVMQPAAAVTVVKAKKAPAATMTIDADGTAEHLRAGTLASFSPALLDSSKFSFTAPGQTGANARMQTVERAFRFTPSGKADSRKSLSIGVTSRVVASALDTSRAAAVPVEVAA
ncbi:MAG: hypothetical protein ACRYG4_15455, partial [Janthinobacterium lividum]